MNTEMTEEELDRVQKELNEVVKSDEGYCPFTKDFQRTIDKARRALTLEKENAELRRDKKRLSYAILYPHKFSHLMETRAHGGFLEEELKQGREAIDKAMSGE